MTDLKKLANDILHADNETKMHRLLAPLTAEETEAVAQLVEMAAMKAWVEREREKAQHELSECSFAAFPFATFRRLGKRPSSLFHSEKPVAVDARSAYESQPTVSTFPTNTRLQFAVGLRSSPGQI
jgi:hypothetical protein